MKRLLVAFTVVTLTQSVAAQNAFPQASSVDVRAGQALWESSSLQCRNCHGTAGQGGFGPTLAGHKLTAAQFASAVHQPSAIMPAFNEAQVSDAEAANLAAYFGSLPSPAQMGAWRFPVPAGASRGEVVFLTSGCGQCHNPGFNGPRRDMAAVGADFDWFKTIVYSAAEVLPAHLKLTGQEVPDRVHMGNFSPERMPEAQLREIYDWAKDLGFRVPIEGRFSKPLATTNGVTYTLDVENAGVAGKGLSAEDVTIRVTIPSGASVVSAAGAGYQGIATDEKTKANVAVWRVSLLPPKVKQSYTLTLAGLDIAASELRADIGWTKPAVKPGPFDQVTISTAKK